MASATATCPLPGEHDVSSLLGDLVGKEVTATTMHPRLRAVHLLTIATYTTVDGALVSACLCDLQVASAVGAALAMVPAAVANQSLDTGTLSPQLLENTTEVLNVASRWVNGEGSPRLVLGTVIPPAGEVDDAVLALLHDASARVDFEIAIEDYGTGTLSVLAR